MHNPTGLTNETGKRMQLDAGLFIEDFDYSSATDAATFKGLLEAAVAAKTGLLGATRGGGTFVATPSMREPDVDGRRARTKRMIVNDGWDVRITGTLIEAYPNNFKRALASADISTNDKVDVLTLRTDVEDTDYIDSLVWVSRLGDGTYMVIELYNVINLDGLTFTFADKNEGTIPFNFAATEDDPTGDDEAPFKITYFHP